MNAFTVRIVRRHVRLDVSLHASFACMALPEAPRIWRCLAGAVLVEQHDEWEAADRRYLSEASMAALAVLEAPAAEPIEEVILLPELAAA